jgi:2',3'-cyclic-nucleotide 2'-phosphodiesterase (5'-nucleotidase family)
VGEEAEAKGQDRGKGPGESGSETPKPNEKRDGLLLFAGDVFNPSVESSVTRGSHMVPVLNMLGIDVACIGNHDFDFGTSVISA